MMVGRRVAFLVGLSVLGLCWGVARAGAEEPRIVPVWPGKAPGETKELPPEADQTKAEDRLIAGRRIIKLGNVSTPTLAVFSPPADKNTGAAIVICPGGGHHILAYDLEGTEVAEWLNGIGVTGIVLKYRVPARDPVQRFRAAVQDAQRAMSVVRSRAAELGVDPQRIGILGFSAGGETAALAALFEQRLYEPVDDVDQVAQRPDFAVLVYPAYLANKENTALRDDIQVTAKTPPMFFVHAFNDPIHPANSILLALALKRAGVTAELHLYTAGGHGYGLRKTDDPVTTWPQRCEEWLRANGWLSPRK